MDKNLKLTKSKYCEFWQCPKRAWLSDNKPELAEEDPAAAARMEAGHEVGELAKALFGSYTDITTITDGCLDRATMETKTRQEMENGTKTICEASFNYNGLYCAVDILRRDGSGWVIYEVKSSTKPSKPFYRADVAYQLYVLEHCGIKVSGANIVVVNREYVYDGTLNLQKLFRITDITKKARAEQDTVKGNLARAARIMACSAEPEIKFSDSCNKPYPCPFWHYCSKDEPEVLSPSGPDRIDIDQIRRYLSRIWFPLYFLDFETLQPVIPRYIGTRPYDQIPFQYSLHYYDYKDGDLQHKEFLAQPGTDPRRALAEKLCDDIVPWSCIVAYNKVFECTRLKELAAAFPDLSDRLLSIERHIIDLMLPFKCRWYYKSAMGNSYSIKAVLPALFPDDPSLNYHNLEQIHNGSEAMAAFPAMEHMSPKELQKTRQALLKYCELDTLAMVKIWQKLNAEAMAPGTT